MMHASRSDEGKAVQTHAGAPPATSFASRGYLPRTTSKSYTEGVQEKSQNMAYSSS
jgi:hypothetical protein